MRRQSPRTRALLAWLLALAVAGCATPGVDPAPGSQPEPESGWISKPLWTGHRFAVAAAHPLAAEAGESILRAGGSAIDAAVAVQMVLALVEPQSSGIGGGAFLLYHDGTRTEAFDGRETAPAAAGEDLFLLPDGTPMPLQQAMVGGRAVGAPGAVAMLEMVHRRHGRLPWARLLEPAITLAADGFLVTPRLHALLAQETALRKDADARAYWYDAQGQPWPVGTRLRNPELAAVLSEVAVRGAAALSEGEVARAIVEKVRAHPTNPGRLSLEDLAGYRARERAPLCMDHDAAGRGLRICGMPPPSSGLITLAQIIGLLQRVDPGEAPGADAAPSAAWLHVYTESARLAFADRAQYIADPEFVPAPGAGWTSLLAPDYLDVRARLIGPRAGVGATAGRPGGTKSAFAPMAEQEEHGTSHISIIDGMGSALAMTTSIEAGWGSRVMVNRGRGLVGGFLLNNQLTDFSFAPRGADGRPVADRVQPGKRPRSSMAPTLVIDRRTGQPVLALGSPGGTMIVHYTAKALWAWMHWGRDPQQAVALPNFGQPGEGRVLLEAGRFPETTVRALQDRGHRIAQVPLTSGLHVLERTAQGLRGGADPRREGVVLGD